jgi:hypothetical protein
MDQRRIAVIRSFVERLPQKNAQKYPSLLTKVIMAWEEFKEADD